MLRAPCIGLLLWIVWPLFLRADEAQTSDPNDKAQAVFFADRVLPLLKQHCFDCHSHAAGEASGELMLDSLAAMRRGGTRGSAVAPHEPDKSPLYSALTYAKNDLQMPPDTPLPASEIDVIRRWIEQGCQVPEAFQGQVETAETQPGRMSLARTHWAYQPPKPITAARGNSNGAGPIDQILSERLSAQGLGYSPRADRPTLLRRLYYDLTGLPPTYEAMEGFVNDPRDDLMVVRQWVDQLLASPQFGERWARYWMDVARYADNKGYVFREDREYPKAYEYRDWLIQAFNRDMPYDQFVAHQIATDLIEKESPENLPALGFLTLGRRFLNNKYDVIDDRLDVVSRGLMGMTLACARCHDHKYDPISQKDYYSLFGVFLNTEEPGGDPWPHRLQDTEKERDSFVLLRGSPGNRGEKVARQFVRFLAPDAQPFQRGSGRAELAERIVSVGNPLTARVFANRVWMRLTGASLVESPSDLGVRCPEPKQLKLLDNLALHLVRKNWSLKSLVRQVVLSDCYAQSSLDRPQASAVDPANELYWRMNRRRLDFESLRDSLLVRTQGMDFSVFGPSEPIHQPPFSARRTVYAYIDRQNLPSVFRTFDMASPDAHSPRRMKTSVPQQGLFMLNSRFVASRAEFLGDEMRDHAQTHGDSSAVTWLFTRVLGRAPNREELGWFEEFLSNDQAESWNVPDEAWICGHAEIDSAGQNLTGFQRLPMHVDGAWQGGSQLPDASLGWCRLTAEGGHPGNDLQHGVVRRWIAPRSGEISIRGQLKHPADKGDGVRGTLLIQGSAVDQWIVQHGNQKTNLRRFSVQAEDTVDFVTDCRASPSFDSFEWQVAIQYSDAGGGRFQSKQQFPGPLPQRLDRWGQAVQALLVSNELSFID